MPTLFTPFCSTTPEEGFVGEKGPLLMVATSVGENGDPGGKDPVGVTGENAPCPSKDNGDSCPFGEKEVPSDNGPVSFICDDDDDDDDDEDGVSGLSGDTGRLGEWYNLAGKYGDTGLSSTLTTLTTFLPGHL